MARLREARLTIHRSRPSFTMLYVLQVEGKSSQTSLHPSTSIQLTPPPQGPIHFSNVAPLAILLPSYSGLRICIPCLFFSNAYLPGSSCSPNFRTCLSCKRVSWARLGPCHITEHRALARFSPDKLIVFCQQCVPTDQRDLGYLLIKSEE